MQQTATTQATNGGQDPNFSLSQLLELIRTEVRAEWHATQQERGSVQPMSTPTSQSLQAGQEPRIPAVTWTTPVVAALQSLQAGQGPRITWTQAPGVLLAYKYFVVVGTGRELLCGSHLRLRAFVLGVLNIICPIQLRAVSLGWACLQCPWGGHVGCRCSPAIPRLAPCTLSNSLPVLGYA